MSEDAVELPLVLWHSWRMVLFRPRALRRLYRRVFRAGRPQPRRAHDTARLRHAFCAFTGTRASRRTAARTCGWRSPTSAPQAHPSLDNSGQLRGPAPSAWSVCLGSGQLEVCHEEARWWCWLASGRPKEDCGIAPANRMLDAVGVEIWVASYDRTDERTEIDGWSGRAVDVDGRAQLPGSSVALVRVSSEASVTPGPEASRAPGLVQASTASSSRLEGVLRL